MFKTLGLFSMGSFALPIVSEFCLFVDNVIYGVAYHAMNAFLEIVRITSGITANAGPLNDIMHRVMALAGIYALFRLAISLVNYLVNTDKSNDISKNGLTYIKNIVIAVILLVIMTPAFNYTGKISTAIIEDGVIEKVVFGNIDNGTESTIQKDSKAFVYHVFSLFFKPRSGTCENNNSGYCGAYNKLLSGDDSTHLITDLTGAYYAGFEYIPIISGIAGILLAYYFIRFCSELAVRILKLLVLQLIAPIPIIMSIDPKNNKRLGVFFSTYLNIWAQVFVRIVTVYLAYVACYVVSSSELLNTTSEWKWLIELLLYMGIFQGASQIPKLIDDVLGTKLATGTSGKSFGSVLGSIIGGAAGAFGGAIAGGFQGAAAGGGFSNMASGILTGATSGLTSGTKAGNAKSAVAAMGEIGKSWGSASKSAGNVIGAGGLLAYGAGGVENFFGGKARDEARIKQFEKDKESKSKEHDAILKTDAENIRSKRDELSQYTNVRDAQNAKLSTNSQMESLRNSLSNSYDRKYGTSLNKQLAEDEQLKIMRNQLAGLDKNSATYASDFATAQSLIDERTAQITDSYNAAKQAYFDENFNKLHNGDMTIDDTFKDAIDDYNQYVQENNMDDRMINSFDDISNTEALNKADRDAISKSIAEEDAKITKARDELRNLENDKMTHEQAKEDALKAIDDELKAFKERDDVKRRNNRDKGDKGGYHRPTNI